MARYPVLLMTRQLSWGGTEKQTAEVAQFLNRDVYEPHVACFVPEGIRADELKLAGIPVVRFGVRSFRNPTVVIGARQMGRYLSEHKIRLVHTFDVPANIFGVLTATAYKCQYIISSQRAQRCLNDQLTRTLLRVTDRLSDRIVVNCNAVQRELVEESGTPRDRIRLVYNGVDTEVFHPRIRERKPQLQDAATVIGVVCALRPEKNLETLLRAFARISPGNPDVLLAIVGSGPCESALQAEARRLDITKKCLFFPATKSVHEWLRSIDIFVLPSVAEALSNSVMEAMASGCAVIASDVGGNPELVKDGRTGFIFPARDVEGLAARLQLLVSNHELYKRFGAAGADRMATGFSSSRSIRQMENVYQELLAGPPNLSRDSQLYTPGVLPTDKRV